MKTKIARLLLLLLVLGSWVTDTGCSFDGKATLTVRNTGPATIIVFFIDVTSKLETGTIETYTVTLPGKKASDQALIWYPVIHPNRRFYETVTLEHNVTTSIDLFYDPQNPPPDQD